VVLPILPEGFSGTDPAASMNTLGHRCGDPFSGHHQRRQGTAEMFGTKTPGFG
jgi:hypothetical protein